MQHMPHKQMQHSLFDWAFPRPQTSLFHNLDLRVARSPEWKTTPSRTSGVRNGFSMLNTMLKTLKRLHNTMKTYLKLWGRCLVVELGNLGACRTWVCLMYSGKLTLKKLAWNEHVLKLIAGIHENPDFYIFFYKIASKLGVLIWTKSSSDTIFGHHHILSVLQSNCPKMLEAKTWSVGDAHDSSNLWKMHEITVDIIWLQKKAWVKTCVSSQRQCVLAFFSLPVHIHHQR